MDIYDPSSLGTFATKDTSSNTEKTRRKYARIQMVHSGVLTPGIVLDDNSRYNVPFILTLEPLYFGVLPKSVVPVVFAIVVAILLGLPIAAKINGSLQNIMLEAKRDSIDHSKVDWWVEEGTMFITIWFSSFPIHGHSNGHSLFGRGNDRGRGGDFENFAQTPTMDFVSNDLSTLLIRQFFTLPLFTGV